MTIDVVIPVFRPDDKYARLLTMLEKQTVQPGRIIVMNTDETSYKVAVSSANLEVHHLGLEEFDHGGTRNQGLQFSDADIVLFLTQDAVPQDEWLIERLLACFEKPEIASAYARQLPAADCRIEEQYTRNFNYPKESFVKSIEDLPRLGIKTYFCSNVCCAYRRSVYQKLGGFPTRTIFNEDMIFAATVLKAGYQIAYCADAKVIHSHNYSGRQQFRRNFDMAVSQSDHPEVFAGVHSEGEGVRLVKQTAVFLCRKKKGYRLPYLIWISGCKYLGYWLGRRYKHLPAWMIRFCTMNLHYWQKTG